MYVFRTLIIFCLSGTDAFRIPRGYAQNSEKTPCAPLVMYIRTWPKLAHLGKPEGSLHKMVLVWRAEIWLDLLPKYLRIFIFGSI